MANRSISCLTAVNAETKTATYSKQGIQPGEIAAIMNTPVSQSPKVYAWDSVLVAAIAKVLLDAGVLEAIEVAAGDKAARGHTAAWVFLKSLEFLETVDTQSTAFKTMIDTLLTESLLTQKEVDAIDGLGKREILKSPADKLGFGMIDQGDVEAALKIV
jgi:hypothetical protein